LGNKCAGEQAIVKLVEKAWTTLPTEYIEFLRRNNGSEGEIAIEPGWIQIWAAEEVVHSNEEYRTQEHVPGFFAFGSSGGGEMFAFDGRTAGRSPVVMIPFIPMEIDLALPVAGSFRDFAQHFGKSATEASF
jgi:SMI1 / KNR4 family (SUKH-1)